MWIVVATFFFGSTSIYAFVMWLHVRKLKLGVQNWSSNKGTMFVVGIGRDKTLFPTLNAPERSALKARIAALGETVSDEDLDLFLRLYGRSFIWFLAAELSFMVLLGTATSLLSRG
jgi:hypothetical protein